MKKYKINQTGGIYPLFSDNISESFTKDIYEKQTIEDKRKFSSYCSDTYPELCTIKSDSIGLCKKNKEDCNNPESDSEIPIIDYDLEGIKNVEDEGKKYGYSYNTLDKYCGKYDKMVSYENDIYDKIQNNITFLTYNIWGLLKNADNPDIYKTLLDTFKIRMKAILDIIEENRPDIICFQEVTNEVLEILNKELMKTYPYSYEPYFNSKDIKQYRGKNVECMIFSKYRPKKFNLYNITGSLNYANTICTIEFDTLIVINCYLQAGSKHSPGQTNHWYHHARCRMQELKVLGKIISESKKQNVVVMGDFNFNIKGNIDEWPENKILGELELDDVWSKINKDDPGYTEDTDINKMRWNTKFQEKKFRYDGVLIKGKIKPNEIKIVGNKEIEISKELSDRIKKYWIPQIGDIESKIKYYNKKEKILSLCPSDHFGIFCRLEIIE